LTTPPREERRADITFQQDRNIPASWCLSEYWHYPDVLKTIRPSEVVFDACAGNLALSVLLAPICQRVYACEVNPAVVWRALKTIRYELPPNLFVVCAARHRPAGEATPGIGELPSGGSRGMVRSPVSDAGATMSGS
jgi:hypothetical protein